MTSSRNSITATAIAFLLLLVLGWELLAHSRIAWPIQDHFASAYFSFALLVVPIWFFAFGAAEALRKFLRGTLSRVLFSALLAVPYAVFALPAHQFRWRIELSFFAICLVISTLLESARRQHGTARGGWQDLVVLAALGLAVDLRFFQSAWPYPGMSGIAKLVLVDLALYGYLVIRQLDGIGYDLRPKCADLGIGLREFVFFFPIALGLGVSLNFLHWHSTIPRAVILIGGWAFTFLFIAIPEELFFRGLVQNLLERRLGSQTGLAITSVLFGLSHFNKRLGASVIGFNWRYVLLATIAGIFYGRAWRVKRRLMASAITHTTVDVVWGIWLR